MGILSTQTNRNLIKLTNPNRYGIYPLTAYVPKQPPACRPRAISPETAESVKSVTPEPIDVETRRVVNMMCSVKPREDGCDLLVSICIIAAPAPKLNNY